MAACPYGRASMCFPLAIPAQAALRAVEAAEGLQVIAAEVAGYTTGKTRAAGADSVRVRLPPAGLATVLEQGAHLVTVRASGRSGWLLGLAGTLVGRAEGDPEAAEVVLLARPDEKMRSVMYLPEATIRELLPEGSAVELRALRFLLPVQHDCPEQWLRDRLLRLANLVEEAYADARAPEPSPEEVRGALAAAGLVLGAPPAQKPMPTLPADTGDRVSKEELGYWDEEMRLNTRCGASMEGETRLDYFMSHMPG